MKYQGYKGSRSDEWGTDKLLFEHLNELYRFNLDVAATRKNHLCKRYFTLKSDALKQPDWKGMCWLNPPFSIARPFFEQARFYRVVAIYKACNLETALWQDVIFPHAVWVCFIRGRTEYIKPTKNKNGVPFGSALIGFNVGCKVGHLGETRYRK